MVWSGLRILFLCPSQFGRHYARRERELCLLYYMCMFALLVGVFVYRVLDASCPGQYRNRSVQTVSLHARTSAHINTAPMLYLSSTGTAFYMLLENVVCSESSAVSRL